MPALVSPTDETQTLEHRVRAYLDANCAACHQPGGLTRTPWDARIGTALDQMGLIGVRSSASSIGLGEFRIDPGHPENSSLFRRISTLGAFHMPPLGTSEMDTAAVDLIRRWIVEDLPQRQGTINGQPGGYRNPGSLTDRSRWIRIVTDSTTSPNTC